MILRVGKELPDLFASLDAQVCDTLDYTTEKGFKTKAASTTWFKRTPPILMFQQSVGLNSFIHSETNFRAESWIRPGEKNIYKIICSSQF